MNTEWIDEWSDRALEPHRVRRALQQLSERWSDDQPPLVELFAADPPIAEAVTHLLSVSPGSAEKLTNDPAALLWLMHPEICQSERGAGRMRADYEACPGGREAPSTHPSPAKMPTGTRSFDATFSALRRWKGRELLRVALREVAGWSPIEKTTLELSTVAEICVREVAEGWFGELSRRWGRPATEFAVLGMGKFGGQELNYSSDIDVVFFYGEDGRLNARFTHQEFFARLAENIVGTFSSHDSAGALFRIDLRLRPEGASGPIVRSLESIENYYAAHGETWERMALIKARVVAGSAELGYEFGQRLQPFVFPRTVSLDAVEEIRAIKLRIEREIVGEAKLRRNVKLGYGGIREIEFVAQTLQILHGARHAFLQERSTLKSLRALRQLDIIPHGEMEALIDAYRFLRTVEHRLQIEREAQTHTLPERLEALEMLAQSLALSGAIPAGTVAAFQRTLNEHTANVRRIFDKILNAPAASAEVPRDLSFFQEPELARKALIDLGAGPTSVVVSARTRKLFPKLEPLLLDWLRRVADPDAALIRFVRFVERYGARGLLLETLVGNPRLLELLVRLFDASRFLSEIALRRPQLIEEVARGRGLGATCAVSDYLDGLASDDQTVPWMERLRVFRRAEVLRIGLRDVLGFAALGQVQSEYSALAEACLLFAQEQLGLTEELTIVALGKFGGRELSYGADLDVVFIGEKNKAAAEIMRAMTQVTAEGSVFSVDPRLRPEGDAGPLACTLEAYETYFEKRAQMWEAQSLTKARAISGPRREEFSQLAQRNWRRFGKREDLFAQIRSMHQRIVRQRASGDDFVDFKTGTGGLMQVEFFTQAQQMRANIPEPNTLAALRGLAQAGEIDESAANELSQSYEFLRRCEAVLRRMDDKSISSIPRDELEQTRLGVRCGTKSRAEFIARYSAAREAIRTHARLRVP